MKCFCGKEMQQDPETLVWGCDDSVYVPPEAHFDDSEDETEEEEGSAFEEEKKHLGWRIGLLLRYGPLIPMGFLLLDPPIHSHLNQLLNQTNVYDPYLTVFIVSAAWLMAQTGWLLGYLYGRRKFKRKDPWNPKEEVQKFTNKPL